MDLVKTINKEYKNELTINKSVFICSLFPVNSSDEALEILNQTKKKYFDANHNCYSYICGNDQSVIRYSDDGEPSQTAGIVIYNVLKKNNLTNVLAIVTRYFGGIKLGASGLVRAYSQAVAMVLKDIEVLSLVKSIVVTIKVNYMNYNRLSNYLLSFTEKDKDFKDNVTLSYCIDLSMIDEFKKRIIEITKNQVDINVSEPFYQFI